MGSLCVNFRRAAMLLIVMRRNSFCAAEAQTMRPGYLKHDRRAGTMCVRLIIIWSYVQKKGPG